MTPAAQLLLGADPAPPGSHCWDCNRSAVGVCQLCRLALCEIHYNEHTQNRARVRRCYWSRDRQAQLERRR